MINEYKIENESLLSEDYKQAALSLVWFRNDQKRTIIFALIELLPTEFPKAIEINEMSISVNKKGYQRQAFYYEKTVDTIENILKLYRLIQENNDLDLVINKKVFTNYNYKADVCFPQLLISDNLPFVYGYEKCIRHNTLYNCQFPFDVRQLIYEERYKNFINKNINFDIIKYPEYIGTINIVAYNPLIRDVRVCLLKDNKKILVEIEPRANKRLSNLKFIHIEKRLTGYNNFKEIPIKENSFIINTNNDIEEIGHIIICPKRGIIEWSKFCGFLKSIHFSMDIISGEKNVNIPSKNLKNAKESSYNTHVIGNFIESVVEDEDSTSPSLREHLLSCNKLKNLQKEKNNHIQRLFYDKPEDAILFVRKLIANAHSKVIIIDPYFKVKELFNFAYAVKKSQVPINIITSFVGLKDGENSAKAMEFAKNIKNNIDKNKFVNKINVYIMVGDKPAFHDRFIIVDNMVWLSGNSLADIGKRASILVKLQYPTEIIDIYEQIVNDTNKCLLLEDWINGKTTS